MSNELTIIQVAQRENVTTKAVYDWMRDGLEYRMEPVGGLRQERRIRASDLDDFLTRRREARA